MAQDRLILGGAVVVLLVGALTEFARAPSVPAGILDWTIGAAWAAAAVRSAPGGRMPAALGLLTAASWFLATGLGPLVPVFSLSIAYRGPLLHWLTSRTPSRPRTAERVLVAFGYVAAVVGTTGAAVAGAVVALALAVLLLRSSRGRGRADLRRTGAGTAVLVAVLAVLWLLAAVDLVPAALLTTATTATLLWSAWHLLRPGPGLAPAIGDLVLDLGPDSGRALPVTASLAAALADPALRIRAFRPDLGWRDELGRPAADPLSEDRVAGLTWTDAPGGGRVVLLHGERGVADTSLARAAAAAAALVLERVAVEADVQREAEEVRRSAARLVSVNEAEREALATRLEAGPIARLHVVGRALRSSGDGGAEPVLEELDGVTDELRRLAAGLNPIRISQGRLDDALHELATTSPVPVELALEGPITGLAEAEAALAWFISAECLANVAKHSAASAARLQVVVDAERLVVEVQDDGRGGASTAAGHGLQGLADRLALAGGALEVVSPSGGPTVVRAEVPLSRPSVSGPEAPA